MRFRSVFPALLASTLLWGCQVGPQEVLDPSQRIERPDYSVLPPSGKGWFVEKKDENTLVFYKVTADPRHTIFGTITHTKKQYESLEQLYEYWEKTTGAKLEEKDLLAPQLKLYYETSLPYEAIRGEYQTVTPGIPGNPDTGWETSGFFISTLHPHTRNRIDLLFTQRHPPGMSDMPIVDEVDHLFASLEFKEAKKTSASTSSSKTSSKTSSESGW